LAIVVVVLGALFAIVAQQFNGGFTSTSKANAVIEGAGKMASTWENINQSCGTSLDPASTTLLTTPTVTNALSLLQSGDTTLLNSSMSGCYTASGAKPLARTITKNGAAYSIESAKLDATAPMAFASNVLSIKFTAVPSNIATPIYQKLVDKSASAPTATSNSVITFATNSTNWDVTFKYNE
jgi:hypothetical protein